MALTQQERNQRWRETHKDKIREYNHHYWITHYEERKHYSTVYKRRTRARECDKHLWELWEVLNWGASKGGIRIFHSPSSNKQAIISLMETNKCPD